MPRPKNDLYEKYRALYPDSKIYNVFLLDARRAESQIQQCAKCSGYDKQLCQGFTPVISDESGELTLRYCVCQFRKAALEQARVQRRFNMAKIPAKYVGKTFADYEVDANNKVSVAWAKKLTSLYLCGSPGTGKTFLAAIMAQELLRQGKSVIFGDVPTLLDQLKGTFDSDSDSTLDELMKMLAEVDVLILDDLGTETPTDWAVERLYLIINNRYTAGKTLIVTSNYAPDDAQERLNNPKGKSRSVTGSRIISRIKEMCRLCYLAGADRRERKKC